MNSKTFSVTIPLIPFPFNKNPSLSYLYVEWAFAVLASLY
ncbi:hypothetical protein [Aeromonas phage AS-zj]|uniref:Uncharacterized protein n=1 Tax=Aeromonas phage AS-zj TaxID=2024208 RepID=A0A223LF58_9CAUD|nr:hypothetical protein HWB28_gp016 [Aeromonas phage AS-zj]ASU00536.1 hypothetical protein [Aeromonas phage AS-zj]